MDRFMVLERAPKLEDRDERFKMKWGGYGDPAIHWGPKHQMTGHVG